MLSVSNKWYVMTTAFAFLANAIVGLAKLLIYSKIFEKQDFGLYSIVLLFSTVATYFSCLGCIEGLNRQLPLDYSKGNYRKFNYYVFSSFSFCLIFTLFVSFSIVLIPFFLDEITVPIDAFYLSSILLISTVCFNLVSSYLRSQCLPLELNLYTLCKNTFSIVFSLISYKFYGIKGVVLTEFCIVLLFSLIMYNSLNIKKYRLLLKKQSKTFFVKKIILIGFPFMVGNLILTLSNSIDSFYIQHNKKLEEYAIYAFSLIIFTAGQSVNALINQIFQPKILSIYSQNNSLIDFNRSVFKIIFLITFVYFLLYWPFWKTFCFVILEYYKIYTPAINLFTPIYFASASMSIITILEWPQLLKKEGKNTLINYCIGLIFVSTCCFMLGESADLIFYAYIFLLGKIIVLILSLLSVLRNKNSPLNG